MIVLSRREGCAVVIGDEIFVRVVDIGPDKVLLGVSGPPGTTVCREELLVVPDAVVNAEKPREENP